MATRKSTKKTQEAPFETDNHDVLTLEAEDIGTDPLVSEINTALVKQNVTDAVINSMAEKFGGMRLSSLDDKEGYLTIKEARKEVRSIGIIAEKICAKGREDAIRTQRLWIAKEKETLAKIAKVQDPLDAELKRYEEEQDRREKERIRLVEEAFILRQQVLSKMGVQYMNNMFMLSHDEHGSCEFSLQEIKEAEESTWVKRILPAFTEIYQNIEAARIAEDNRKKKEDEERKTAQAKLDAEREAMLAERFEMREFQLDKIGMARDGEVFFFENLLRISAQEVRHMEPDTYKSKLEQFTKAISDFKAQAAKREQDTLLVNNRISMIKGLSIEGGVWVYKYKSENSTTEVATKEIILQHTDESWQKVVDAMTTLIEEDAIKYEDGIRSKAAEKERIQVMGESRHRMLSALGNVELSVTQLGSLSEESWRGLYAREEMLYNTRKQEEADKATDKEKWKHFINMLPTPTVKFKSNLYKGKMSQAIQMLRQIAQL
jgi:hypothetical protein